MIERGPTWHNIGTALMFCSRCECVRRFLVATCAPDGKPVSFLDVIAVCQHPIINCHSASPILCAFKLTNEAQLAVAETRARADALEVYNQCAEAMGWRT